MMKATKSWLRSSGGFTPRKREQIPFPDKAGHGLSAFDRGELSACFLARDLCENQSAPLFRTHRGYVATMQPIYLNAPPVEGAFNGARRCSCKTAARETGRDFGAARR